MELGGVQGIADAWLTKVQLDLLCDRAAGLSVYAVATVGFVAWESEYPKEQLDCLLQSMRFEGSIRLLKENQTLDPFYMSILLEAFVNDNSKDNPTVWSTLGVVVLAINPLPPSSITALLDLDPDDVFHFLSLARSLLVLGDDIDHTVRPFHQFFTDFIVDSARCGNPRFRVSPPDQHAQLMVGCLELMN